MYARKKVMIIRPWLYDLLISIKHGKLFTAVRVEVHWLSVYTIGSERL